MARMNLAEEFICPVCLITCRHFIYTCKFGHVVCGQCIIRLENKTCPICRSRPLFRNQLAERLASKCFGTELIYCRYSILGCKSSAFGLERILGHELDCGYKCDGRTAEQRSRLVCSCVLCTGESSGSDPKGEPTITCRYLFLWKELLSSKKKCCCRLSTSCQFNRTKACPCFTCAPKDTPYWSSYAPCRHETPCLGVDCH